MLWKCADSPQRQTTSLARRLTYLYTFSTMGLLFVVALLFFPSLVRILSHDNPNATLECFKQIMLMSLCVSVGAILLGQFIARRGLNKINELQQAMTRISGEALEERLDVNNWPLELRPLGEQFNHMLGRLQRAFDQLAQFSSDIAHELRHPIHHLMQITELSLSKPDAQVSNDVLVTYMKEFQDLSRLVEQLLFISRSEQAQIQLDKQLIDLPQLIDKIFEYYQAWADEKNITLSCSGMAQLTADPILLQRALCNLCANSLQFTENGGVIAVKISAPEHQQVLIEICDDGTGIDTQHLPHLFQRFYQVETARSRPGTLGLGLPIVKSIVDLHGGEISIQSEQGVGTTVSILFSSNYLL